MNRRLVLSSMLAAALFVPSIHAASAAGSESPVAPEVSPPGDIPDSQAFIIFKSPDGFSLKVPEGWARKNSNNETVFNDKYTHSSLSVTDTQTPIGLPEAKSKLVPELESSGRAVKITRISELRLKAGTVVKIAFDSNSEPNEVTNKQVREENERFYFVKNNKLVLLQLSAPKGADNVDQWKLISSSFRWN